MWTDTRVVVLGGAGFLGSHLCETLIAQGRARRLRRQPGDGASLATWTPLRGSGRLVQVTRDITLPLELEGPVDVVFNLASPASPIDYAQLPLETLRVGSLGTEHGLELARRKSAVFVQASTSEVYGDPLHHPQREEDFGNVNPVGPRSVYDEAKRYGEALVSAYRRHRAVDARIARIFNTYGPRMRLDDGRVVPSFVGQALRREPLTIFGDGEQTRSFCYVSDLIGGLLRLAEVETAGPINLGNPVELTMIELVRELERALGETLEVRAPAAAPGRSPPASPGHHPRPGAPRLGAARDAARGAGPDHRLVPGPGPAARAASGQGRGLSESPVRGAGVRELPTPRASRSWAEGGAVRIPTCR